MLSESYPRTKRLLKKSDFFFRPFQRVDLGDFRFVVGPGEGRLGISLSKKTLKSAVSRNRVKRLLRECFRLQKEEVSHLDWHVIGQRRLKETWKELSLSDIERRFEAIKNRKLFEKRELGDQASVQALP